jgi:hypothetical protein
MASGIPHREPAGLRIERGDPAYMRVLLPREMCRQRRDLNDLAGIGLFHRGRGQCNEGATETSALALRKRSADKICAIEPPGWRRARDTSSAGTTAVTSKARSYAEARFHQFRRG